GAGSTGGPEFFQAALPETLTGPALAVTWPFACLSCPCGGRGARRVSRWRAGEAARASGSLAGADRRLLSRRGNWGARRRKSTGGAHRCAARILGRGGGRYGLEPGGIDGARVAA